MRKQQFENPSNGIKHELNSPVGNPFEKREGGKKKDKPKDNRPYLQFRKKSRIDLFR